MERKKVNKTTILKNIIIFGIILFMCLAAYEGYSMITEVIEYHAAYPRWGPPYHIKEHIIQCLKAIPCGIYMYLAFALINIYNKKNF